MKKWWRGFCDRADQIARHRAMLSIRLAAFEAQAAIPLEPFSPEQRVRYERARRHFQAMRERFEPYVLDRAGRERHYPQRSSYWRDARFLVTSVAWFLLGLGRWSAELREKPPRCAAWILELALSRRDRNIPSELAEILQDVKIPRLGVFWARVWYCKEVALILGGKLPARVMRWAALGAVIERLRHWL